MIERSIIEKVQNAPPGSGQEQLAKALLANFRGLKATGLRDIDPTDSSIPAELEANRIERQKQVERLISIGCAGYLKMTPEEYDASIPLFELPSEDSEGYEGQVVIEGRIPAKNFLQMAGIELTFDLPYQYNQRVRVTWYQRSTISGFAVMESYPKMNGSTDRLRRGIKGPSIIEAANGRLQISGLNYITTDQSGANIFIIGGKNPQLKKEEYRSSAFCV